MVKAAGGVMVCKRRLGGFYSMEVRSLIALLDDNDDEILRFCCHKKQRVEKVGSWWCQSEIGTKDRGWIGDREALHGSSMGGDEWETGAASSEAKRSEERRSEEKRGEEKREAESTATTTTTTTMCMPVNKDMCRKRAAEHDLEESCPKRERRVRFNQVMAVRRYAQEPDEVQEHAPAKNDDTYEIAKQEDGPALLSFITSSLITAMASKKVVDGEGVLLEVRRCLRSHNGGAEKEEGAKQPLDGSAMEWMALNGVYLKVQNMAEQVKERGYAGLLPSTIKVTPAFIPALQYTQQLIHAAGIQLISRRAQAAMSYHVSEAERISTCNLVHSQPCQA
eukprot:762925-Hanusia_phi.AAC.2